MSAILKTKNYRKIEEKFTNEKNIKRICYIGLGIEIIVIITIIGIFATKNIFATYNIIPNFVMTIFWIRMFICIITSIIRIGLKKVIFK